MRNEASPLLAEATPTEVEALAAYAARVASKMTTDMTLGRPDRAAALVRYYNSLCRKVGLDTVLVVCQSWHETSVWSSWWFRAPRRNPAGIGVTGARAGQPQDTGRWQPHPDGDYAKGWAFPSFAIAAMQHVHGLAMWAGTDPTPVTVMLKRQHVDRIYTPPPSAHGSCTEWRHLGQRHNPNRIGWAYPGLYYGHNIARLANATARVAA